VSDSAEDFLASHGDPRPPTVLRDGDVVAGWRITAFLGRGGSGEVYRVERLPAADAPPEPSPAALKILAKDADTARARFVREAELLAKMNNPAFPRFIAKGEADGRPWLVTELLEPHILPSTDAEAADFLLKLCEGVAALHRMGYIHRDIKPGNILWRGSAPVLIDLGLVKDVTRNFKAEGTSISLINGHVAGVGTPGYSAPEQLAGDAVSPTADIHALGMLARECFNGRPPSAWERVIRRAVSSVPAYRYPGIAAFARAVRRRHLRRNLAFAACGVALICIALAGLALRRPSPARLTEEQIAAGEMSGWAAMCTDVTTNRLTTQTLGWATLTNALPGIPGRFWVTPSEHRTCILTNEVAATVVRLGGRTNVFTRPLRLEAGREYWIVGPGTLDAAISGPSNTAYHVARRRAAEYVKQTDSATGREYYVKNSILMAVNEQDFCNNAPSNGVVHLVNCTVVNRADVFWPRSGLYYELEDGSHLLFPNLRENPTLFQSDYAAPFDEARNEIRFGEPAN